jgi:surface antigen
MRKAQAASKTVLLLGSFLALTVLIGNSPAQAKSANDASTHISRARNASLVGHNSHSHLRGAALSGHSAIRARSGAHAARKVRGAHVHLAAYRPVVQCVPFARAVSGIALKGNAAVWWDQAAGIYARGHTPEVGSILNFRASRAMPLGHVAVVTRVVNSREIEVEHAHWAGSGIKRDVLVIDVSPNGDWSAVRVALSRNGPLGNSVYPTYGFIYNRPAAPTTQMARVSQSEDEVAEAPASDAPASSGLDRSLR